jgi:hypothetical protein
MKYDQSLKKQANDYEKIAMCWHEAGHTICGLFNFLKVYHVNVLSSKYIDGNTSYEIHDSDTITNKLLAKILIIYEVQTLYAGLVGEKMYYEDICGSNVFPMTLRIGSSDDIRDAARLIDRYNLADPGKSRFWFKKQVQNDAKKILSNYWDDVQLVAHALYKSTDLDFNELRYLLTRKSVNKDFWRPHLKELKDMYADNTLLDEKYLKDVLMKNNVIIM